LRFWGFSCSLSRRNLFFTESGIVVSRLDAYVPSYPEPYIFVHDEQRDIASHEGGNWNLCPQRFPKSVLLSYLSIFAPVIHLISPRESFCRLSFRTGCFCQCFLFNCAQDLGPTVLPGFQLGHKVVELLRDLFFSSLNKCLNFRLAYVPVPWTVDSSLSAATTIFFIFCFCVVSYHLPHSLYLSVNVPRIFWAIGKQINRILF
jgi:hypothetical protein